MDPDRRLKQFVVPPDVVSAALRGEGIAMPLPPGSDVIFGVWQGDRQEWVFTVHNPAFPATERGISPPVSLNGPRLPEVQ